VHFTLKLIKVGNSVGATFPKEMLSALKVEGGDSLTVTQSPDGYRITPYNPEIEKQISAGREVMSEFRDTLRALAK
jgi:putative addiction module antidote